MIRGGSLLNKLESSIRAERRFSSNTRYPDVYHGFRLVSDTALRGGLFISDISRYFKTCYREDFPSDFQGYFNGFRIVNDTVPRGGSWLNYSKYCHQVLRNCNYSNNANLNLGFRLICSHLKNIKHV
jgi:formylglycine-generating enzyme required for sulfatase activity